MNTKRSIQKFLALGDSYTIGESVSEDERWPNLLANSLRTRGYSAGIPVIIAKTGWRTDNLAHAIEEAKLVPDFDLVSLLIGVNNQYQGQSVKVYQPEFKKLLNTAVQLGGGKKENVFVVSIPDYGFTPFGKSKQEKISRELDEYNSVNRELTEVAGILYVNITDISRQGLDNPDLIAKDELHPSGMQYKLWVERIFGALISGS